MAHLSYIRSHEKQYVDYKTIPQHMKDAAQRYPDREAVILYSANGIRESITFSEMYIKCREFANVLSTMGIKKGDRLVIRLYNSIEWLIIVFSLMIVGAIPVFSYIIRKDISDLYSIFEKTGAVGIFFAGFAHDLTQGLKLLKNQMTHQLKYIISTDIVDDEELFLSFSKLLERTTNELPLGDVYIDPDEEACIMRTSGTTGKPKLISHSHMNLCKYSGYIQKQGVTLFSNCDFSWLGGTPITQVCTGVPRVTVLGDPSLMSVEEMLTYTERESCDFISMTTHAMNTILKDKLRLPSCLKTIELGGSPIRRQFQVLLDDVECLYCGYGNLEIGDICEIEIKKGMVLEDYIGGYPFPGVEIKVVNENNMVVETGNVGRIFARSDAMLLGFTGDEDMTRKAISAARWYNTEDTGYIAECGKLFVLGRAEDCVTRDTATMHVSDIEKVLEDIKLPDIADLVVVPVPDEENYEEICACVILNPGHMITEDELSQIFDHEINESYYKPRYIVFMEAFPLNTNGKVSRKSIKEHATRTLFGK